MVSVYIFKGGRIQSAVARVIVWLLLGMWRIQKAFGFSWLVYPIIYRVLAPSQVVLSPDFNHQQYGMPKFIPTRRANPEQSDSSGWTALDLLLKRKDMGWEKLRKACHGHANQVASKLKTFGKKGVHVTRQSWQDTNQADNSHQIQLLLSAAMVIRSARQLTEMDSTSH